MKWHGVHLSVPVWAHSSKTVAAGLLHGPSRQEILIDRCSGDRRMRVALHCYHCK